MPSYAGLADGRGVDERSQFLIERQILVLQIVDCGTHLDILAEESVEEVDVGGLEVDKVLEFLERCRLHSQEAEALRGSQQLVSTTQCPNNNSHRSVWTS